MEKKFKISVLTPTFNREHLLERLYQSLVKNSQYDLEVEWLIMDDGSTDNTKEKVSELKKEGKIEIQYYVQENQGKMVAINKLVKQATGKLIIECDDDDYFTQDAFKLIQKEYEYNKNRKDIYGFCFLKYDQEGKNMGNLFSKKETTMFDLYFKEGETGEKAIVFFSDIRKKYKHELEKQEKFITEARMYHKMDLERKIICINQPIMICEYQKDGYTKNIIKQFKENPEGYYQYFKEIFEHDMKQIPLKKRLYVIKHYILFAQLAKKKNSFKQVKGLLNKILYILLCVPGKLETKRRFQ